MKHLRQIIRELILEKAWHEYSKSDIKGLEIKKKKKKKLKKNLKYYKKFQATEKAWEKRGQKMQKIIDKAEGEAPADDAADSPDAPPPKDQRAEVFADAEQITKEKIPPEEGVAKFLDGWHGDLKPYGKKTIDAKGRYKGLKDGAVGAAKNATPEEMQGKVKGAVDSWKTKYKPETWSTKRFPKHGLTKLTDMVDDVAGELAKNESVNRLSDNQIQNIVWNICDQVVFGDDILS